MPADITNTNGRSEMMYTGQTPWHGLGVRLDGPATAVEAMAAANMDWQVEALPVYTEQRKEIPGFKAITRMDTNDVFAVMKDRYTPLQNADAFSFFDAVVGNGEAIYHTAGTIKGGRRVWILAKLPNDLQVSNADVLEKYILLANSHDGTSAVTMKPTAIRVVCNNTLNFALSFNEGGKRFYSRHVGNIFSRVTNARETLGLVEAHFEMMMLGVNRIAEQSMDESSESFLRRLFEADQEEAEVSTRQQNQFAEIDQLFRAGRGNNGETKWDMFNGVVEWIDYQRGRDSTRLEAAWFGTGEQLKQRAWDLLTV